MYMPRGWRNNNSPATARNSAKVYERIDAGIFFLYGETLQQGPGRMDDGVRSAVFSADGSKVVTSSVDGTVRTWEAGTGRQILFLDLGRGKKYPDYRSLREAAEFSPADTWLTVLDEERRLRIWRTDTGKEINLGQVDPENVASVAIDESDSHLLITHLDGTICLFRDFF
jgi:WD40 repeat protein